MRTGGEQHHPPGMVGYLFRVDTAPAVSNVGNCFFQGRFKNGDLVLCVEHAGDYFQNYIFIQEYANALEGLPAYKFGAYGMPGKLRQVSDKAFHLLQAGEIVYFEEDKQEDTEVRVSRAVLTEQEEK